MSRQPSPPKYLVNGVWVGADGNPVSPPPPSEPSLSPDAPIEPPPSEPQVAYIGRRKKADTE